MPNRKLNIGEKVYHRHLGLPANIEDHFGRQFYLEPTAHAVKECRNDPIYPNFPLPNGATVTRHNIIEVTLDIWKRPVVFVIREPIPDTDYDRVLVFNPNPKVLKIITCWANRWDDNYHEVNPNYYTAGEVFLGPQY